MWSQVETGKERQTWGGTQMSTEDWGRGGGMAPSRPRPLGTWRLQYSNTMYTWSRSAKCPWKATMLRCRRQQIGRAHV